MVRQGSNTLDNKTSTGNVSNITNEWKKKIGKPETEQYENLLF